MKDNSRGSIKELLPIAFPIFFSQSVDVLMVFTDRYFLAGLGKEELAASFTGGILYYLICNLCFGILGQIAPIVAQYRGAGEMETGVRTVHQGFILALVLSPLLYLIGYNSSPYILDFFNHAEKLHENELKYFRILSLTIMIASIRLVFANFFIGIGKTRIVTLGALSAVIINIPVTYILIFGKFGFPKLGIEGAAIGTVLSSIFPVIILGINFFKKKNREEFKTSTSFKYNKELTFKLVKYGFPSGIELLLNVSGFFFFSMVMYSYSSEVAAATSIVLNWDMVCFIPLIGIGQAVGSLIGKYLGEEEKEIALKSAWSALKIGAMYSIIITIVYFSFTEHLVSIFSTPEDQGRKEVYLYANMMLKISCIYFFFDAAYSILGGILRGAGDTFWVMVVSNSIMWATATTVYLTKNYFQFTPIHSWLSLTLMVFSLCIIFMIRFLQKKWLDRLMIR